MPDGTLSDDPDAYANAWLALAQPALDVFPGYQMHGWNPGVSLYCPERPNEQLIHLSVAALHALADGLRRHDARSVK
jgi:hypothetical protein